MQALQYSAGSLIGTGSEFLSAQKYLSSLFSSNSAESELKIIYPAKTDFPSWLTFIALSAIWNFLNELEHGVYQTTSDGTLLGPSNKSLHEWWWGSNPRNPDLTLKTFKEIWEDCIERPFPLRDEAAYYSFKHDGYLRKSSAETQKDQEAPTEADLDCIIRLGLLVSPVETSDEQPQQLFAEDFRQHLNKTDLCVTDNGYAFVMGNSLIVAVKRESYRIQGSDVDESDYWRWMFRLLSCLRECFLLCDISSRDIRELRE